MHGFPWPPIPTALLKLVRRRLELAARVLDDTEADARIELSARLP